MILNLENLKSELDIVNVIARHVNLKPQGTRYIGHCPFHTENTPSFTVTPSLGLFKCFGCGKTGDVFTFEQEITGKTFPETVEALAREFNLPLEQTAIREEELQTYQQKERLYLTNAQVHELWQGLQAEPLEGQEVLLGQRSFQPETVRHFQVIATTGANCLAQKFKEEHLDKEILLELGLLKAGEKGDLRDFFRQRIIFPIRTHHGKIAGFAGRRLSDEQERRPKYLNSPDSAIFKKGELLFGLHENSAEIRQKKEVILVEGYFDVLTLWEHGFKNAVAVCGTAFTPVQAKLLRKHTERVTLLFDGDPAGAEAMCKAYPILEKEGLFVRVCPLPEGEDPDSYLRKNSAEQLQQHWTEHCADALIWLANYRFKQTGDDGLAKQKLVAELRQLLTETPFDALRKQWAKTVAKLLDVRVGQLTESSAKNTSREEITGGADERQEPEMPPDNPDNFDSLGYFEAGCCYFRKDKKARPAKLSNFVLHPLYQINTKHGAQRLFRLENEFGETCIARFTGNSLISVDSFQQVVEQCGNYVFHGRKSDLSAIKEKVFAGLPVCQEIDLLGWQEKYRFWAWSNGIALGDQFFPVNEDGMVQLDGQWFYLPAHSGLNGSAGCEEERNFRYEKGEVTIAQWCEKIMEVYRENQNGTMLCLYYLASIFRDVVFKEFRFFPLLFAFGPRGTGKSQMAWSVSHLYGKPQKQFMLSSGTNVGLGRKASKFANSIIWFDEYKNTILSSRVEVLKGLYDGAGYVRGQYTNDNATNETATYSGAYITGQDLPTADVALLMRTILQRTAKTRFTQEEGQRFRELKAMEQQGGLSYLTSQIAGLHPKVEKYLAGEFPAIQHAIKAHLHIDKQEDETEERLVNNYVILLTIAHLIATDIGLPMSFLKHAEEAVLTAIKTHQQMLSGTDDTAQFWEIFEHLVEQNILQSGRDFCVEERQSVTVRVPDGDKQEMAFQPAERLLCIRIKKVLPAYLESSRRTFGREGLAKITLEHYLKSSLAYLGAVDSWRFADTVTSGLVFRFKGLNIDLKGEMRGDEFL